MSVGPGGRPQKPEPPRYPLKRSDVRGEVFRVDRRTGAHHADAAADPAVDIDRFLKPKLRSG
jgi:hypothetical protein